MPRSQNKMYIKNLDQTSIVAFQCGSYLASYLIRNKIPLLSQKDDVFYFADTQDLRSVIENAPLFVKFLDKVNLGFKF